MKYFIMERGPMKGSEDMTHYQDLPREQQRIIEKFAVADRHAQQYFVALFKILPPDAKSPAALMVTKYGDYNHEAQKRREELTAAGMDFNEIARLSFEYWQSEQEERPASPTGD